ncbi:hypothetical protein Tco_1120809 [Tanacetum coccineum]
MALHTQGKKKANPLMIPSVRFTKLIIHHLQSKHKFYPRPDSLVHLPYEEYVLGYLKFSTKGTKREVFRMPIPNDLITTDIREGSDLESPAPKPAKATKPEATKKSKPSAPKAAPVTKPAAAKAAKEKKRKLVTKKPDEPSPAKSSKRVLVTKRHKPTSSLRLVDEFVDEGIPEKEPSLNDVEVDTQRAIEESLKDVVHFLLWRTPALTEPSGHAKSPSLYAELGLTDSDTESDKEVPPVDKSGAQDEGQA